MAHDIVGVVMAAGKGTRMKSARPKVLHPVAGISMLERVLRSARRAGLDRFLVVVGHGADEVIRSFPDATDIEWVRQDDPRGTGHAVMMSASGLESSGRVHALILSGDVPLLGPEPMRRFIREHLEGGHRASLMTTRLDDPTGYGRVLRDAGDGSRIVRIVEDRDADARVREIDEINAGIYLFETGLLLDHVGRLRPENAQQEYYLPDVVASMAADGVAVRGAMELPAMPLLGINNRVDLARAEGAVFRDNAHRWMLEGVTVVDPDHCYVHDEVEIGADTIVHPGVILAGRTRIGAGCVLDGHCVIRDSEVGDGTAIREFTVIERSRIGRRCQVGPCAHLRPGSHLEDEVKVGNFVEIKKSHLGRGTKASHLTYLGDARIGAGVNVGAGTITCNYDGFRKHVTEIGDGAFIGSDSVLVAPVRIGQRAYVAAASAITRDVPDEALAIGRGRQVNKPGYRTLLEERSGTVSHPPEFTAQPVHGRQMCPSCKEDRPFGAEGVSAYVEGPKGRSDAADGVQIADQGPEPAAEGPKEE